MSLPAPWSSPLAASLLAPLGWGWAAVGGMRRALYRRGLKRGRRLPAPTISVGNLTVGGTGKTPMVAHLLATLPDEFRPPLVLSRGYGDALVIDGAAANDEGHLLRRRFPDLLLAAAPDRAAAAAPFFARETPPACVILDDGAQHLQIERDLEIMLLDVRSLVGPRRVLPAGPWREGLGAAAAADLLVLTRGEEVSAEDLATAEASLVRHFPRTPRFRARHAPRRLRSLGGTVEDLGVLRGRRVGLVCGIARPESFRRVVEELGAEVAFALSRPDHRAFDAALGEDLRRRVAASGADLVLTTEKDAPKILAADEAAWPDLRVLEIDLELDDEPRFRELVLARLREAAR
ncbi:MAG: tetraacyldisaccharide 4'-kinase [Planctomycetota bacterium]